MLCEDFRQLDPLTAQARRVLTKLEQREDYDEHWYYPPVTAYYPDSVAVEKLYDERQAGAASRQPAISVCWQFWSRLART